MLVAAKETGVDRKCVFAGNARDDLIVCAVSADDLRKTDMNEQLNREFELLLLLTRKEEECFLCLISKLDASSR